MATQGWQASATEGPAKRIVGSTGGPTIPLIPLVILALFIVSGIFSGLIAPHSPHEQTLSDRLMHPFWQSGGTISHPLGTDHLGRDYLSRLIWGARVSLLVAFVTVFIAGAIGMVVGIISGYLGGWIDAFVMRLVDATITFPIILVALLLVVTLGPSIKNVVIAIVFILWARYARVIRGEVLKVKEADFIAQARINGCSSLRIMARHIAPNVMNTLIVLLTLQVGWVLLAESSLSFLGAGVPVGTPSWGAMVSDGAPYLNTAWWLSIFPGAAIMLAVLSFNWVGDWLRDTLDPKLRQL